MKPTEIVISLWYQASLRVFDSGAPPTDADLKKKKKRQTNSIAHSHQNIIVLSLQGVVRLSNTGVPKEP